MKSRTSLLGLVSLAAALPIVVACNASPSGQTSPPAASTTEPAASAAAAATAAVPTTMAAMRGHDRGRAWMLFRAASDLPTLTDAQKTTMTNLENQLEGAPSPKDSLKTVQADLAAGVRANKIDSAKIETDYAAVDKAMQAHAAAEADAVNGLHAALDAGQRTALVASIRAQHEAHEARHEAHEGMDASAADWSKRRLDRMTKQLDLDQAQQTAVAALLAKEPITPHAMQAHAEEAKQKMDAMMTAFAGETFDAKTFQSEPAGDKPHDMMQKDAAFLGQLLPILKPAQRETLATEREQMGSGMRGRRPSGDESRGEGTEGAGGE